MKTIPNINLYHGDCMEAMKDIPDNHYDLAIVDPPYGIGVDGQKEQKNNFKKKHNRKGHIKKNWDTSIPDKLYFIELSRVSINQIIWGANYFVENITPTKGWVVWYKGQEGLTMSDAELAFSSFDCPTRVVKINRASLISQKTFHPTEKPIKLYKWLLKNYAKEGDKILDTHGGSMSIAIACHDMGFDLDLWELDEDYYKAGCKRFKNHTDQMQLF